MKIYSVYDNEFKSYGRIHTHYNISSLLNAMENIDLPEKGVVYERSINMLESTPIFMEFKNSFAGGNDIQIGICMGHNTKLNCLEYHRSSELNIGFEDFILLLAKKEKIKDDWTLSTNDIKAFYAPKNCVVEIYSTSLHYAPVEVSSKGFKTAVILPKGTNSVLAVHSQLSQEDKLLWATNKWLIAHGESNEAKEGAFVGLTGENIEINLGGK